MLALCVAVSAIATPAAARNRHWIDEVTGGYGATVVYTVRCATCANG